MFIQLGKAALDYLASGDNCKRVQLAALDNFYPHLLAQHLPHALRKRLTRVATIGQHTLWTMSRY